MHDPATNDSSAPEPSGLAAWLLLAGRHWPGAAALALLAGALAFWADNPLRVITQVQFFVALPTATPDSVASAQDIARLMGSLGVADGGREASVTAKAERDLNLISVSVSLQRPLGAEEPRQIAQSLAEEAAMVLRPRIEAAREALETGLRSRSEAYAKVMQALESAPTAAAASEGQALLLQQAGELRTGIADVQERLRKVGGPAIIGAVRATSGRSAVRAWAAPAAAAGLAFFVAPFLLTALQPHRRPGSAPAHG